MAIHYQCRHCGTKLGTISEWTADEKTLGFHMLDEEERENMIRYDNRGDIHVDTICEDCEKTLSDHPDYHQYESFLQ
ncbi:MULTISPECIES: anti-sigma-F factor Fin family protein [Alteribacter]|uniref:Anti-sigma-F factor Fin family protein n=1 Tax=Alteribacter keqinensis TaxID=2483800 RepID=A0A3M7TP71_9BACI|nr:MULTISPECIES: anti-sigma-F factor Fin family protein [Alteribacter]MBM7097940.1 anti-sigma-F factor Fin family protein [Alteribacter salitolerans]RNA66041.1 anti-sigma-F factor Fin family protein [Alteribacter keqinensis]